MPPASIVNYIRYLGS